MKKHIRPCSRRHPYIYIRVPDGYCIENHSFKHKRQSNQQMGCCPLCGLIRKDKTMARTPDLTDGQVEMEIQRLNESPAVLLARQEQRLKYKKRQYLYTLRCLEKRGKQLMEQGITYEMMKDAE